MNYMIDVIEIKTHSDITRNRNSWYVVGCYPIMRLRRLYSEFQRLHYQTLDIDDQKAFTYFYLQLAEPPYGTRAGIQFVRGLERYQMINAILQIKMYKKNLKKS